MYLNKNRTKVFLFFIKIFITIVGLNIFLTTVFTVIKLVLKK